MKKFMTVFVLLILGVVGAALWFSPFSGKGARAYVNNEPKYDIDGLCYAEDACVRYDFCGSENDMYAALDELRAKPVRVAETDGVTVVYALSDRVCAASNTLSNGKKYNVMASFRSGRIAIGAPVLQGSY